MKFFNFTKREPYVPEYPGAKLDKPDPRDLREKEVAALKRIPVPELIEEHGTEYRASNLKADYQDGQGECVHQSYSFMYRQLYYEKHGRNLDMSEAFSYTMGEEVEPGPADPGARSRDVAKVWQKYGVCEAKYYQPDRKIGFENYVNPHNIPQDAIDDAREHKIGKYSRVDGLGFGEVTLEGILNAIVKYGAVEICLRGRKKDWLQEDGIIHSPAKDKSIFYHSIVANGWKALDGWEGDPHGKILPRGVNYWDKSRTGQLKYGQGSFFFVPRDYLPHIYSGLVVHGLAEPEEPVFGWVAGDYIEKTQKFSAGQKVETRDDLHLRNLPVVKVDNVAGTIKQGEVLEIEKNSNNGKKYGDYRWWRVKVKKSSLK